MTTDNVTLTLSGDLKAKIETCLRTAQGMIGALETLLVQADLVERGAAGGLSIRIERTDPTPPKERP